MCGIVGIVGARDPIDARAVLAMRDRLAHRGPDDAGLAVTPDGRTALGHRRLAILDPTATGHEPMWNRSRTLLAAADGGITNFRELAAELSGAGYAFATRSGTEVLLAACEHWGVGAIERLRGAFAFAVRNEEADECLLARDRLGVKPLYYAVIDGALHFASEATALLAAPSMPRELDLEALGDYLAYGYVPGERSIWKSIRKLPAAHRLVFRHGDNGEPEIRIERYWQPPEAGEVVEPTGDDISRLREVLEEAVRLSMVADVPVGALLSGELDSSLLMALMGATGDRVHSYTIDFDRDPQRSRLAFARRVAERYAAEHHERRLILDRSLTTLTRAVSIHDEPFADESIVPHFLAAQDVAAEMKLAVSSEGGGVVLGAEPDPATSPPGTRNLERLFGQTCFFDAQSRRALLDPAITRSMDDDVLRLYRPHWHPELPARRRLRFLELHTLADHMLTRIDRGGMHHALEVRLPLLDHQVVEEGLRLGHASGRANGHPPLNALASDLLPEKEPSTAPFGWRWLEGLGKHARAMLSGRSSGHSPMGRSPFDPHDRSPEMSAEGRARLLSGGLVRRGLVRLTAVEHLLAGDSRRHRRRAWLLLVLDLWLDTHLD